MLLLSFPAVQTKIGQFATKKINESLNINVTVGKIDLSLLGSVSLKDVKLRDHHQDTLIFVDKLSSTVVSFRKILDNKVELKSASIDGVYMNMKTYEGEDNDNLSMFIDSIDSKEVDTTSAPFYLTVDNIYLENVNFKTVDENVENPILFGAFNGGGNLENFTIVDSDISAQINGLYLTESRGIEVQNLTTTFAYSSTGMEFHNTRIVTPNSDIKATIDFNYRIRGLQNFSELVNVTATFTDSKIAVKDLAKLYSEFKGDDVFTLNGDFLGSLNNFQATDLTLTSKNGIKLVGAVNLIDAVKSKDNVISTVFFDELSANYENISGLLPNVLGSILPIEFKKFGNFTFQGSAKLSPRDIETSMSLATKIGDIYVDLEMNNVQDKNNVMYNGEIDVDSLELGQLLDRSFLGLVSFKGDVIGKGLARDHINTSLMGKFPIFTLNGYTYKDISVNGDYNESVFDGNLVVDDKNLQLTFDGLADLSENELKKFDFNASVAHADLNKMNLFKRDSISHLKGDISLDIIGSSIEDIVGKVVFKNVSYTNQTRDFALKNFIIFSSLRDSVRTIVVDSEDIIKGDLTGKFMFKEVGAIVQNALFQTSTNYIPIPVTKNQYLDFNCTIHNQIVEMLLPQIDIGSNTKIKASIDANQNKLKVNISSPKIVAYGNRIDNLSLRTDNQSKLYNAFLTASSISSKYYRMDSIRLMNRAVNDTLYFKSVFKGGKNTQEDFNLDFYYTLNNEQKSVVGIQPSSFSFNNFKWDINSANDKNHTLTINSKTNEILLEPFKFVSGKQEIEFKGILRDSTYKDFKARFRDVNMASILLPIDSLELHGTLTGTASFVQQGEKIAPKGKLTVKDFKINELKQGDMFINVKGRDSYTDYFLDFYIKRDGVKSISAKGSLNVANNKPSIDLDVSMNEFGLAAFNPLGQDVVSNLRGTMSGNLNVIGFLGNPEINGNLVAKKSGIKIPYLNVDYDFVNDAVFEFDEHSIIINPITLDDIKYNTKGLLKGSVTHRYFKEWFLDMDISSKNLLVLDTEDSEEAQYYGTAFIDGGATISGLTSRLDIAVNAKTNPNTVFVIPLKDIATVETYKLIHFKSEKTFEERQKEIAMKSLDGLSLTFDLEVTKDAVAQVVIDEVNGSDIKGSGDGDLRIEIDTRGKFNIFGDFTIDNGFYNFKYGGVVNKPFSIQKGGTISWSGSPFEANLNITAVYTTNANPSILLEGFNSNKKIPVDLETHITGSLFNSKQDFDIKIPNVNPAIAGELQFVINDNDMNSKLQQFLSLLVLRTFMDPNKNTINGQNLIAGTTSDIIGSVLSDMISSKDGKLALGFNYSTGDATTDVKDIDTGDQFDVSATAQIGDRVIVNGKVGVPVGSHTQSSVVGEVKVEVLLNDSGTFRGVIFNRQNEIQYSTQDEGYTQGIGLSYQVNFNTLSELLQKVRLKKEKSHDFSGKNTSFVKKKHKLINFKSSN